MFLADRNILANQAYNSFSAFADDALVRIDPEVIKKRGRAPKNGSIFFTIFQIFMTEKANSSFHSTSSGQAAQSADDLRTERSRSPVQYNFSDYPPNFFDFIIIDECHRGGASDESTWRGIL